MDVNYYDQLLDILIELDAPMEVLIQIPDLPLPFVRAMVELFQPVPDYMSDVSEEEEEEPNVP